MRCGRRWLLASGLGRRRPAGVALRPGRNGRPIPHCLLQRFHALCPRIAGQASGRRCFENCLIPTGVRFLKRFANTPVAGIDTFLRNLHHVRILRVVLQGSGPCRRWRIFGARLWFWFRSEGHPQGLAPAGAAGLAGDRRLRRRNVAFRPSAAPGPRWRRGIAVLLLVVGVPRKCGRLPDELVQRERRLLDRLPQPLRRLPRAVVVYLAGHQGSCLVIVELASGLGRRRFAALHAH